MCGAGDDAFYVCFGEIKDKYFNRLLRHGIEMRHRNLCFDLVLVHTGYIDTGAILYRVSVPNPTHQHYGYSLVPLYETPISIVFTQYVSACVSVLDFRFSLTSVFSLVILSFF